MPQLQLNDYLNEGKLWKCTQRNNNNIHLQYSCRRQQHSNVTKEQGPWLVYADNLDLQRFPCNQTNSVLKLSEVVNLWKLQDQSGQYSFRTVVHTTAPLLSMHCTLCHCSAPCRDVSTSRPLNTCGRCRRRTDGQDDVVCGCLQMLVGKTSRLRAKRLYFVNIFETRARAVA